MRSGYLASLLLILVFGLGGCGDKELDHYGGVQNKAVPASIISLSPSTTEIIARWGPLDKLRGRTTSCNWPTYVKQTPIVGDVKPNYEAIAMMKPKIDLIIYDDQLYSAHDLAKLKTLGARLRPFGANTLDEFAEQLYKLGSDLGSETKSSEYVDKIMAARARGQADARDPRPKVALLMGDYLAGTKSLYADMVRASGGEPVGPDSQQWEKLNREAITQWNPDVLLIASDEMFERFESEAKSDTSRAERKDVVLIKYVPAEVMRDPRLQSLTAIKKRQVASVRPDVIARRGGRIDVMIEGMRMFLGGLP
jgi:ABC-type Fe3+-hydroxamate transport system substrate-binding protein